MTQTIENRGLTVARYRGGDAYERAVKDPFFLAGVRSAHAGRWDVLDALWWESHPNETAPSGTAAPAARLTDLQRRLFSADGDAVGSATVTAAAQELALEIASEQAAIRSALAQAETGRQEQPHSAATEITDLFPAGDEPRATATPVAEAPVSRRRTLAVLVTVLGALVAGVAVGAQFGGSHADAAPTVPSATPAVTLDVAPLPPAGVFQRRQVTDDLPAIEFPPHFEATSFRILSSGVPSEGRTEAVYAAKTTSNMVCLVVVPTNPTYVYTCALEADFPSTGLRVHWAGEVEIQSDTGETSSTRTERYVVWNVDQSVEWGSTGR